MTTMTPGAGPADQRVMPLSWSENKAPDANCSYDHCTAETPFGRFLITWKGWKEYPVPTADETPWGEFFCDGWGTVDEAKAACEKMFAERVMACLVA